MGSFEYLTRDEWTKVAKRRLGTSEFELLACKTRPLSEGGGFLGEHRLADVTVRLRDNPSQRVLHFFIKAQPQALADQKELVDQTGTFRREIDVLTKLFVQLRSVLKNGGEGMEWGCRCFYASNDIIVLEDLNAIGFRVLHTSMESTYEHCAVVLRALANLHSASLIFEENQPMQPYRLGDEYPDMLTEVFFKHAPNHPGDKWLITCLKTVCALVEEIRGKEAFLSMKSQIEKAMDETFELVKTSVRFRNTVSHGDVWRNNMLFRYKSGMPVEVRLVDYQVVRYTPPANDVMCFLYLTTNRSFRAQYSSQLLTLYHDHLSQNLRCHGLQPDSILPWSEFKESCVEHEKLGVRQACSYLPVIMMKEEDIKHVFTSTTEFQRFLMDDRSHEVLQEFRRDKQYRERITEVIEEFIEICIENK